jgi:hypothetical protein
MNVANATALIWITGLKAPQVKALRDEGKLSASLFDECNIAQIDGHQEYPGERLIVCRNPLLAAERARKREELLVATESKFLPIQERCPQRHVAWRG